MGKSDGKEHWDNYCLKGMKPFNIVVLGDSDCINNYWSGGEKYNVISV